MAWWTHRWWGVHATSTLHYAAHSHVNKILRVASTSVENLSRFAEKVSPSMFYDLNIPWPSHGLAVDVPTKKGKKNNQPSSAPVLEEAPDDDPLARLLPAEQQRITTLTYELRSCTCSELIQWGTM